MGQVIMMAAVSTGVNESGLASIDVPLAGNLIGISWAGYTDFDTDNDYQVWQLSFGSTFTIANDSRGVIDNATAGEFTTTATGMVVGKVDRYTSLPDIPCGMGERLYLHSMAAVGVVGTVRACLHFDFNLDKPLVRRR
jgi:hypothetical protein